MPLKIVEMHHHAIRVAAGEQNLAEAVNFYRDILGLELDPGRPNMDLLGAWMSVGNRTQIHLMSIEGTHRLAVGPGKDPSNPHIALAVPDIQEAKAELTRCGTEYFTINVTTDARAEQIFILDPAGNLVELHQLGTCRCTRIPAGDTTRPDDRC